MHLLLTNIKIDENFAISEDELINKIEETDHLLKTKNVNFKERVDIVCKEIYPKNFYSEDEIVKELKQGTWKGDVSYKASPAQYDIVDNGIVYGGTPLYEYIFEWYKKHYGEENFETYLMPTDSHCIDYPIIIDNQKFIIAIGITFGVGIITSKDIIRRISNFTPYRYKSLNEEDKSSLSNKLLFLLDFEDLFSTFRAINKNKDNFLVMSSEDLFNAIKHCKMSHVNIEATLQSLQQCIEKLLKYHYMKISSDVNEQNVKNKCSQKKAGHDLESCHQEILKIDPEFIIQWEQIKNFDDFNMTELRYKKGAQSAGLNEIDVIERLNKAMKVFYSYISSYEMKHLVDAEAKPSERTKIIL